MWSHKSHKRTIRAAILIICAETLLHGPVKKRAWLELHSLERVFATKSNIKELIEDLKTAGFNQSEPGIRSKFKKYKAIEEEDEQALLREIGGGLATDQPVPEGREVVSFETVVPEVGGGLAPDQPIEVGREVVSAELASRQQVSNLSGTEPAVSVQEVSEVGEEEEALMAEMMMMMHEAHERLKKEIAVIRDKKLRLRERLASLNPSITEINGVRLYSAERKRSDQVSQTDDSSSTISGDEELATPARKKSKTDSSVSFANTTSSSEIG